MKVDGNQLDTLMYVDAELAEVIICYMVGELLSSINTPQIITEDINTFKLMIGWLVLSGLA